MAEAAPIFHFNDERSFIVEEVVARVAQGARDPLLLLNDAAWCEIRRLEARPGKERAEYERFRELARSLGRLSESERRRRVEEIARHYAKDIAGNFDPRVYALSTKVLPTALSLLLSPKDLKLGLRASNRLREHMVTQGPIERIRALSRRGTVIFAPTHLSNLDSVVFGFALERDGPAPGDLRRRQEPLHQPVPLVLHAQPRRLPRRPAHPARSLQGRPQDLLQRAHRARLPLALLPRRHALPLGHRRARSSSSGLLGTGVEAFVHSLRRSHPQRVFVVPATINYMLTLEASTLIEDYLAEVGRSRYIIEDDESTRIERIVTLLRKLVMTTGSVVIRFGEPMDPFTNRVLDDGRSVDLRGRTVDPASYVTRDGQPVVDEARDAQYTRELGEAICRSFAKETVLLPSHLVAGAAFGKLRDAFPGDDLFKLLRHRDEVFVPSDEMERRVADLVDRARALEDRGALVLGPGVRGASAATILDSATRAWSGYHTNAVLRPAQGGVVLGDTNLLLYYQNRLAVSGLGFHPGRRRS